MSDDKEAGWTKIRIRQTVDHLFKHGPSIDVDVAPIDGGTIARVMAQIDTGASRTGISPRLVKNLGLAPVASGFVHQVGLPRIHVPFFKIRLGFPRLDINIDVVGFATLERPHDILLGRDILGKCRLSVDFLSGVTVLHVKNGP